MSANVERLFEHAPMVGEVSMTARARILVVDDEVGIRDLLAEVLRDAEYDVEVAETAAAARVHMDAIPFDMVICDWWLPDLHGLAVVDDAADRGAKTFLMSGYDLKLIGEAAVRHGMLWKPLEPATLLEAVRDGLAEAAGPIKVLRRSKSRHDARP